MFELAPDSPAPKTRRSYTRKPKSTPQPQETDNGLQDQARQETPPTPVAPAQAPVSPTPPVAEIAQVTTRYNHPVYVASQKKTVYPGEVCPIIVDGWVRHHLGNPRGALVKA